VGLGWITVSVLKAPEAAIEARRSLLDESQVLTSAGFTPTCFRPMGA
jgi:hypothetical protein